MKQKIIPCLEILAISGKKNAKIELGIDRKRGIIDLFPWFEEAFKQRDYYHPKIERVIKTQEHATFSFEMIEFAEAFFGSYRPKGLINFLRPHFAKGDFEKEFLREINSFEKENRIAFSFWQRGSTTFFYHGHKNPWIYFVPYNLPLEELKKEMKETLPKSEFTGRRDIDLAPCLRRKELNKKIENGKISPALYFSINPWDKHSLAKLRENFLGKDPPLIIIPRLNWLPVLNYFSFIDCYKLDTSNLIIYKKDRAQSL